MTVAAWAAGAVAAQSFRMAEAEAVLVSVEAMAGGRVATRDRGEAVDRPG